MFLLLLWTSIYACSNTSPSSNTVVPFAVGAELVDQYVPLLDGQNVGVVANQTSMVNDEHLVDVL